MLQNYLASCFNCFSEFDAVEAIWCSCNPQNPTKVCPFCLGCFCAATPDFKASFWDKAPEILRSEVSTLSQSKMLIGEMLVRAGLISTTQLLAALTQQKSDGRRVGEILVDSGALPAERLERFLNSQHTVPAVDPAKARVDAILLRRIGVDECLRDLILPLEPEAFRDRQIMTLVMADPSNAELAERIMKTTGCQIIPASAAADAIRTAILTIFPKGSATEVDAVARVEQEAAEATENDQTRSIVSTAARRRASHIEIHRRRGEWGLFFRIDGVLYRDRAVTPQAAHDILRSFQAAAGMPPGEPAAPRSGRAAFDVEGLAHQTVVRLRREGDSVWMSVKVIDPISFPRRFDDLGLPDDLADRLRGALERESGLILLCAPAGGGGTNTLYALALEALSHGRPIATIESPRTSSIEGATQLEYTAERTGSFNEAVTRALSGGARLLVFCATEGLDWVREQPSLTEQTVVICRIEAPDLATGLLSLASAGYPAANLALRPTFAIHQRLVRRVCPTCRAQEGTAVAMAGAMGLSSEAAARTRVWRGRGCKSCSLTPGFRGRTLLAHGLRITREVADAVASGSPPAAAAACLAAGLSPFAAEIARVLDAGLTAPEEFAPRRQGQPVRE